jgi:hypothetical protein
MNIVTYLHKLRIAMDLCSFWGLHFKHGLKIVNLLRVIKNLANFDFLF